MKQPANPYPGPRPFQSGETLYGRERETLELLDLLIAERIVLLYSPSGAGKTSLIQAALVPQLRAEGYQVLPTMRLNADPALAPSGPDSNRYLFSALLSLEQKLPDELQTPRSGLAAVTMDEYLTQRQPQEEASLDPGNQGTASQVLIFDQFEEIITVDPTNLAAKERFFAEVGQALRNRNRWAIFAMREDYVAALDPYLRAIPTRFATTFRLDLLGPEAAGEAIRGPAAAVGVTVTDSAAEKLIADLRQVQVQRPDGSLETQPGLHVEPVQLQVVSLRLWDKLPEGTTEIVEEDVAGLGDVNLALGDYYAETVAGVAAATGESERTLREWFDRQLITEGGVRGQVLLEKERSRGLGNAAIRLLEDKHLVRADERRGTTWFELSHDRLLQPVRANNAEWFQQHLNTLQRQADLWDSRDRQPGLLLSDQALVEAEEWAQEHPEELTETEREFLSSARAVRDAAEREVRDNQRIRRLAVGVSILAFAALLASLFAFWQAQAANVQRQVTEARQLAAQSMELITREIDTSLLLAVEADRRQQRPLPDVRGSLLSASQCCSDSLIAFLRGHSDRVWDVAFSPNGSQLASGGDDGTVIVWDIATRTQITTLVNLSTTAAIYSVAFRPQGDVLAAGDGDGGIVLSDTQSWQPIGPAWRGHSFNVHAIAFSPDGSLLVSGGGDGKVVVWDVATGQALHTLDAHTNWVWDVAISPDQRTLASVGRDKRARIWELTPSGAIGRSWELSAPHDAIITSIVFNDDPVLPLMLTGDTEGGVVIWDMRPWQANRAEPTASGRQRISTISNASRIIWGLAFVPGSGLSFVSSAGNGTLRRHRIVFADEFGESSVQKEKLGVTGHATGVFRIAVSPGGAIVAAAGQDGLVSLWTAEEAANVFWHTAALSSMRVITPGNVLAAVDSAGQVYRWDYGRQELAAQVALSPGAEYATNAISFDGALIAGGDVSGTVTLWDGETGERRTALSGSDARIESLAFSPDGQLLAAGDQQGTVIVWDVTSEEEAWRFGRQRSAIQDLLFSPDGRTLIVGGCGHPITFPNPDCGRGAIYLLDRASGELRGEPLPGKSGFVLSLAFNPANSNELAVGTRDGSITVWDLANRRQRFSFAIADSSDVLALAFSPDGQLLVAGIKFFRLYVYDTQTGQPFGRFFKEHDDWVTSLAFSPDGASLFSASRDRTIVMHDMRPESWRRRACQFANRNLTPEEWQLYVDADPGTYRETCK